MKTQGKRKEGQKTKQKPQNEASCQIGDREEEIKYKKRTNQPIDPLKNKP